MPDARRRARPSPRPSVLAAPLLVRIFYGSRTWRRSDVRSDACRLGAKAVRLPAIDSTIQRASRLARRPTLGGALSAVERIDRDYTDATPWHGNVAISALNESHQWKQDPTGPMSLGR